MARDGCASGGQGRWRTSARSASGGCGRFADPIGAAPCEVAPQAISVAQVVSLDRGALISRPGLLFKKSSDPPSPVGSFRSYRRSDLAGRFNSCGCQRVVRVGLKLLYRNPQRPGEAGIKLVPDRSQRAAEKKTLEKLGFTVVETSSAPFAKALHLNGYFAKNIGG